MRKEYRKAVRAAFDEGMREVLPAFRRATVRSPVLLGGETVYRWVASERLHGFVLLQPDARGHQAFTVELGWSVHARFPDLGARPTLILGPDDPDPLDVEEGIVRLGALVERRDRWWRLPDPALERPGELAALQESLRPVPADEARIHARRPVDEALAMLGAGGRAFFEALAARHGVDPEAMERPPEG